MEKDFQAFLSRLKLESSELPLLRPFFRSLLIYRYLFPDTKGFLDSDKISFVSKELQENNLTSLSFILDLFNTTINSSLIDYLKRTDWWWDYLVLFKQKRLTIYQLSSVHESTMSIEDKKSSGVYFTPGPQIRFICKYSLYKRITFSRRLKVKKVDLLKIIFLQDITGLKKDDLRLLSQILCNLKVIDPSCGSGLFLYEMNMIIGSLLRLLTSDDIISYAEYQEYLQTFQSNLTGYDINKEHTIFTKLVLLSTWMHLQPDERIELAQNFEKLYYELDNIQERDFLQTLIPKTNTFDLCIGNPPYLRHHEFDKKSVIQNMIISPVLQNAIKKYNLRFDAKADLYLYFWIKGMILLKLNGVLSFVLSRSWYSSQFMVPINTLISEEEFLLDLILELPSDPWNKAQVRTNIIFGHRNVNMKAHNLIDLLVWKKPVQLLLENFDRYLDLFTKDPKDYSSKHKNHHILSEETKEYRFTRVSNVKALFSQDSSNLYPFMRLDYFTMAPFLIHDILIANRDKFCLLKDLGKSSLGSTTGANAFFYLDERTISRHNLSSKYLVSMTKSPRDAVSLSDFTSNKKLQLLHITQNLKLEDHPNLNIYLEKIQGEILTRPYFRNKSKKDWYKISLIKPDLIIPNMTFLRSFVAYNEKILHIDKQWIGFWAHDKNWLLPLLGFMNSSLGLLMREVQGTRTLGLGSLKLSLGECKNLLVLDPRLFPSSILNDLNSVVLALLKERIPVFGEKTKYTEIQKQLDKILCIDYLGLDPSFIEEMQKTLVFEVEWRLGKPIK